MNEPIEEFLDDLYRLLRTTPRQARRILAESEAHLRDAAEAAEAAGMPREQAESDAVARFGTAEEIASACRPALTRRPRWTDLWALGRIGYLLAGVGLLAVGVSGVVAAMMTQYVGRSFVGGLSATYSAATCRHFVALHPTAGSCGQAAVLENSQDAVSLRLLAGAVGLVLLAAGWLWRRHHHSTPSYMSAIPNGLAPLLATLAFACAAAFLIGQSIDTAVVRGSDGVGFYLSGGIVAALAAGISAAPLYRRYLRT